MNSHCMQIIQMVKKNTLQIYTNSILPNSMSMCKYSNFNNIIILYRLAPYNRLSYSILIITVSRLQPQEYHLKFVK